MKRPMVESTMVFLTPLSDGEQCLPSHVAVSRWEGSSLIYEQTWCIPKLRKFWQVWKSGKITINGLHADDTAGNDRYKTVATTTARPGQFITLGYHLNFEGLE